MKDEIALRKYEPKENKILEDPWKEFTKSSKTRGTQTPSTPKQTTPFSLSSSKIRPTPAMVQDPRDPMQTIDNNVGTHFLANSSSSSPEGPKLVSNVNGSKQGGINIAGGLQKPITIMAKDPKTGVMRPVTLFPKNVKSSPGGITTIQLGQPTTPQVIPHSSATPKPIAPLGSNMSGGMKLPMIVKPPASSVPQTPTPSLNLGEHGLICRDMCSCPRMNGANIPEKVQTAIFTKLKTCMKITGKDSETKLTYSWIQDDIFSSLLTNLPRAAFFKLCRIVTHQSPIYTGEKKQCVLIKKRQNNLVDGMFYIKGHNYPIPAILLKLFREGYDAQSLSSLSIESLQDCEMTK